MGSLGKMLRENKSIGGVIKDQYQWLKYQNKKNEFKNIEKI